MQTILAVDDNEEHLIQIENELAKDFDVVAVNSGAMAMKFMSQRVPDLILLGNKSDSGNSDYRQFCVELQNHDSWKKIPATYISELLIKPSLKKEVRDLLFSGVDADEQFLPVISNGKIGEVPMEQIQYIEIYNQIRIVRTQYQELQTRMTAEHLMKRLGNRFLEIGDSLLVNKASIREVVGGVLYMKDGRQLVLPQESRGELVNRIRMAMAVNN